MKNIEPNPVCTIVFCSNLKLKHKNLNSILFDIIEDPRESNIHNNKDLITLTIQPAIMTYLHDGALQDAIMKAMGTKKPRTVLEGEHNRLMALRTQLEQGRPQIQILFEFSTGDDPVALAQEEEMMQGVSSEVKNALHVDDKLPERIVLKWRNLGLENDLVDVQVSSCSCGSKTNSGSEHQGGG